MNVLTEKVYKSQAKMFQMRAKETLSETIRLQQEISSKKQQLEAVTQQLDQKSEEMKNMIDVASSKLIRAKKSYQESEQKSLQSFNAGE